MNGTVPDEVIAKDPARQPVPPNMPDYEAALAAFDWQQVWDALGVDPAGPLNVASLAVDRHADGPRRRHAALRMLGRSGRVEDISYGQLEKLVNRFAITLCRLGIQRGERVFALMPRRLELYAAALGTLKYGAVFCPLFSAFGPEPIEARLSRGDGRVLVTTLRLYDRKVRGLRDRLPGLQHVLIADGVGDGDTHDLGALLAAAGDRAEAAPTGPEDMALLHFTSGTTGAPKGAVHVHAAAAMHWHSARVALDLHPNDVFWCTADPGWVTGTSYGILAPLLHGVTSIVDEAEFDAERWLQILREQRVSVWYTAPTAIRMLMKILPEDTKIDLPDLRFIGSVGEPLNPEAVRWGMATFGMPIHDNWWQTETGGIMIANYAASAIRPGSMGRPLPGVTAAIVARDDAGGVAVLDEPDAEGELALKPGWPSMFRGYLNDEDRYRACFAGDWYLSGDLARRDEDGYFWFVGRASDLIKSSGHLIGPFEVESALMQHPAVAEAGVIGVPDDVAGELVKAFVTLKHGHRPSEELSLEIMGTARRLLGAAVAPREVRIVESLPKTRSGKIVRRLLRARELGLPEGDTSTLENGA